MKCTLIFYMAHKTGYCETALESCLNGSGFSLNAVQTAFSPQMLGAHLNAAFQKTPFVFIVGGLARKDAHNLADVLSRGFQTMQPLPRVQALTHAGKEAGYLLQAGKQAIFALPDDPQQISGMLTDPLLAQVCGHA